MSAKATPQVKEGRISMPNTPELMLSFYVGLSAEVQSFLLPKPHHKLFTLLSIVQKVLLGLIWDTAHYHSLQSSLLPVFASQILILFQITADGKDEVTTFLKAGILSSGDRGGNSRENSFTFGIR